MLNAGAQSFSLSRKAGNETIKEDFPGLDFKRLLTTNWVPVAVEFINSILNADNVWLL